MTLRTVDLSTFKDYLNFVDSSEVERAKRDQRLLRFPHAAMLQVAIPELDFTNQWCWMNSGPRDGDRAQRDSEYRVCQIQHHHSHSGVGLDHWFTKTNYNRLQQVVLRCKKRLREICREHPVHQLGRKLPEVNDDAPIFAIASVSEPRSFRPVPTSGRRC
jgi:hypothetical protein